jgi:hypothetical protein
VLRGYVVNGWVPEDQLRLLPSEALEPVLERRSIALDGLPSALTRVRGLSAPRRVHDPERDPPTRHDAVDITSAPHSRRGPPAGAVAPPSDPMAPRSAIAPSRRSARSREESV